MYLLEGAGELHRAYEMNVGDVMVFAQKPDGTLVVAGRPATRVGAWLHGWVQGWLHGWDVKPKTAQNWGPSARVGAP